MGLCKCRVVTTLFCYQCRLNVCETCLVTDHRTCVVKTYLQWLQDSDFDPSCRLCGDVLNDGQNAKTIRLKCLDIFHVNCLDRHARSLPANTAPAGFACPTCSEPILPAERDGGAVADNARSILKTLSWSGLDGSLATKINVPHHTPAQIPSWNALSPEPEVVDEAGAQQWTVNANSALASTSVATSVTNELVARKIGGASPDDAVAVKIDVDDDKYARRPTNAWLNRVVSNQIDSANTSRTLDGMYVPPESSSGTKRCLMVVVFILIAVYTVVEILNRASSSSKEDPMLDPYLNPNVLTE